MGDKPLKAASSANRARGAARACLSTFQARGSISTQPAPSRHWSSARMPNAISWLKDRRAAEARRLTAFGIDIGDVDGIVSYEGDRLSVERMKLGNVAGASFDMSGVLALSAGVIDGEGRVACGRKIPLPSFRCSTSAFQDDLS